MIDDTQKPGTIPPIQDPIDPNNDMTDVTDTQGLTGMTSNFTPNQSSTAPEQKDAAPPNQATSSTEMEKRANDTASETETISDSNPPEENLVSQKAEEPYVEDTPHDKDYNTIEDVASSIRSTDPQVRGQQSVSGDMPAPESDDDTLENAQAMGFQLDEDSENPKPLKMGADFDKGEEEAHK